MGANINCADTDVEGKQKILEVGAKILKDLSWKLIEIGSNLKINENGVFLNIPIEYETELITVRGRIIDGVIKTGTLFIQPKHVKP